MRFPSNDKLDPLLSQATQSTFGKKGKDVLDLEYRNALCVNPDKFATNFHPSEHGILPDILYHVTYEHSVVLLTLVLICKMMAPQCSELFAELYRLNIYQEGGKFKSHVDTPKGAKLIGSLVVCLPFQHTGKTFLQH